MPANTSKIVYLYDPIKSSEKNTLLGIILFLILISFTLIILRNNLIKFYQKIGGILTNKKVLVVLVINILAIITLAGNIQFDNISDLAGKFVAATIGESCTEADNGACWGSETPCCVDSCGCLDGGEGCSSCCPSNDTGQTYYCNDYSVCEYQSIDHLVYPRETKLDDRSVWLTDANGEFTRVLKTEEDVYDMYTISVGYISFNHMINSNELIVMDSDCMYSGSGDWNVNCSLDCLVLQSVNIMGNNSINFYDSGTATLKADIQTNGIIHIRDGCTVTCISGNIFTKGYLPEPTEIIIKDVSGNNIARFNDIFGNVILKGVLEENSNHQRTTNDEWIINNNNEDVFILDKSNGNLYIDGNLFENQESLNPTEGIDFIIKDKLDNVVIYVNESGSLFLKGGLIESGDP